MTFTPIVLVGPSGVGKGTVLSALRSRCPEIWLSVSVTTRLPRPGEVDGEHYFFLSDDAFDSLIESGGLLEWAAYQTSRYGTPRAAVEEKIGEGRAVVMELDVQGARQVAARLDGVRTVFLAPPSWEELRRRLYGRGTEAADVIERRLDTARGEMDFMEHCDHVVVNTEVESAVRELVKLIGLAASEQPDQRAEKDIHR
ncbi:MAG: guanylate kinase [Propionibacteriaceae bacterium]|nr:guanylate kinase [Propionibacteriaceae bacterium]